VIIFEPSLAIKKSYSRFDFFLFSVAVTAVTTSIFGKQHDVVIPVHTARKGEEDSYYSFSESIYLRIDDNRTINNLLRTLLHELRHWMQHKLFNVKFEIDHKRDSFYKYYKSDEEKDARNFDKLTYKNVRRIYERLINTNTISNEQGLSKYIKEI
jgi:hypothetical protein